MEYPENWTPLQEYIHLSKYSRWNPELGRRENWSETVDRWHGWLTEQAAKCDINLSEYDYDLREMVYNQHVMPSMRSLMTAGPAADRDNTCIYNCSYLELDSPIAMAELLFVLMCGTGVGFSVEARVVDKWPVVPQITRDESVIIKVKDSKQGWADAVKALMSSLLGGVHPTWDISGIRESGARLKTFGGRASGPGPLEDCMRFITNAFYKAQDRRLRPIEVHDMACVIANSVIVGGVRRSAMISLSDLNDKELALAKSGNWWETHPYRALSNNSAVHTNKPAMDVFMEEALAMYRSYSGERGIFNRQAAQDCSRDIGRDADQHFGTNPCGEITLRPMQFCNLTEVVMRPADNQESLIRKVRAATVIGCIQASCTHFPYLRKAWQNNTAEEALLGVSLTGMADGNWGPSTLDRLRREANKTAELWAAKLGINPPAAVTTVKPSGTVSILVDSASGIHERWSQYYLRRVRMDRKDPLCQLMIDQGVPGEPEVNNPANTWVFTFPVGVDREVQEPSAKEQLDTWATVKQFYTDHNPSVTITYNEDEYMDVMSDLYTHHWAYAQGLSFLPKQDAVYKQAPLESIDKEAYEVALAAMPTLDWSKLGEYETVDGTTGSQTLACSGGSCEIADSI